MLEQAAAVRPVLPRFAALLVLAIPLLAATTLLPGSAIAQVGHRTALPTTNEAQTFYQTDSSKQSIRAEVISVTSDRQKATLKVFIGGGSNQRVMKLDDFTPHSRYRIVESVTPTDDAQAQLDLAQYAASLGLTTSADRALQRARSLSSDADLGDGVEDEVKSTAVDARLKEFHDLLNAGKISQAESKLHTLEARYPDQIDSKRAAELQAEVDQAKKDILNGRQVAAANAEEKRAADERERHLRPLRNNLKKGEEVQKKGMADSKHTGSASSSFKRATDLFAKVQKDGDQLVKRYGNDQSLVNEVERLQNSARSHEIDTRLSSASLYMIRGQFNPAMGEVNKVLLMDQGNKRALAMRGRIETSANHGWRW